MSNWLILHYIYTMRWSPVCSSGTENHNSRMSYNKFGLVYFINSVQISSCWHSEVSDQRVTLCYVRDSGDNRKCCSISEEQQGVCVGCLYYEIMYWSCVGSVFCPRFRNTLRQLTRKHSSSINRNNLRWSEVASITAAIFVIVSVFCMGCINWRYFGKQKTLFYLANIV
jgi:hypothetical protein